jgi:hypothetical protein
MVRVRISLIQFYDCEREENSDNMMSYFDKTFYVHPEHAPDERSKRFPNGDITADPWLKWCRESSSEPFHPYEPLLEIEKAKEGADTIKFAGFCDAAGNYYYKKVSHLAASSMAKLYCGQRRGADAQAALVSTSPIRSGRDKG